jgi:hypothetical protein
MHLIITHEQCGQTTYVHVIFFFQRLSHQHFEQYTEY